MIKVKVISEIHSLNEIKNVVESTHVIENWQPVQQTDSFSLAPDAAYIIVSSLNALLVIINSILVYLAKKKSGTITIIGSSGRKIIIPKDANGEIDKYIEHAKELDDTKCIKITLT